MSAPRKRGLGRGLDALLGSGATGAHGGDEGGDELRELPLDWLEPGRHQPRRHFEPEALEELASSIRAQGLVQPILVRPLGGQRYEIVAGERRWRAARLAGLDKVPAIVRELDERATMTTALVENIQRADLNPLEEAEALRRLIDDCGLTHEQVANAVGRKRATISNLLRILELDADIQHSLREGLLSLGHAKALLAAESQRRSALARQCVERGLSVRQLETLIAGPGPAPAAAPRAILTEEQALGHALGLPVRLERNEQGRGKLTIRFRNPTELEALMRRIGS